MGCKESNQTSKHLSLTSLILSGEGANLSPEIPDEVRLEKLQASKIQYHLDDPHVTARPVKSPTAKPTKMKRSRSLSSESSLSSSRSRSSGSRSRSRSKDRSISEEERRKEKKKVEVSLTLGNFACFFSVC